MFQLILFMIADVHAAGSIVMYDLKKPNELTYVNVTDKPTFFDHGPYHCKAVKVNSNTALTCLAYDAQTTVIAKCGSVQTQKIMLNNRMFEVSCYSSETLQEQEAKGGFKEYCSPEGVCEYVPDYRYKYFVEKLSELNNKKCSTERTKK